MNKQEELADWCLCPIGLYTDESPGLKVDPVVVLVLSLGFIFSVVALHSQYRPPRRDPLSLLNPQYSHCEGHSKVLCLKIMFLVEGKKGD